MIDGRRVTAIIVAAGASRRMGFDKLFYPLAGKPVLASMDGAGHDAVAAAGGLASAACSAEALAENLVRLAAMTPQQRGAMGESIKAYYEAHYRRAQILRRLEEFMLDGKA